MLRPSTSKLSLIAVYHSIIFELLAVELFKVCTLRIAIPEEILSENNVEQKSIRSLIKELLEIACPQIHHGILRQVNPSFTRIEDFLVKIDEQVFLANFFCLF